MRSIDVDRLGAETAHVWADDDVRHRQQGERRPVGSVSNTSSATPAITPSVERLDQRGLVHHSPTRRVDQYRVRPHQLQGSSIDQVPSCGNQWAVQRDDVGACASSSASSTARGESESPNAGSRHEQLDVEPGKPAGDQPADVPIADQADGAARQQQWSVRARAVPLAAPNPGVVLGDAPQQGEHHRDRMVGNRLFVRARRGGDGDAELGRRGCIDRVDADADSGDHPQAGTVAQDVTREWIGADDRPGDIGGQRQQLLVRPRPALRGDDASRIRAAVSAPPCCGCSVS